MPKVRSISTFVLLTLALSVTGCASLPKAESAISEAALVLTDATNAVNIAESELAALHLPSDAQADAAADIAKARQAISAADAIVDGAKDLTGEHLDAALAQFRVAWGEIAHLFAAQTPPNSRPVPLPIPLAVRRAGAA